MTEGKVYIAAPFFNPEQLERVEWIKSVFDQQDIAYYSPKDECFLPANAGMTERRKVFADNVLNIVSAKFVFAVTDGLDAGTIWEAGYAYAANKDIVYFAETLGDRQFNLMLAESGIRVFTDRQTVQSYDFANLTAEPYNGLIE
jgi:nucleoside 2-deoxyribosyltransferase